MGQSVVTIDLGKIYQGTAAAAGGTFTADYLIPIDQCARLVAKAFLTSATSSHLLNAASLRAEYVVTNKNGVVAANTAQAGAVASTNPLNSNTAGEATAHVQTSDSAFVNAGNTWPTLAWSISGSSARATVTNNSSSGVAANVTVIISVEMVGST